MRPQKLAMYLVIIDSAKQMAVHVIKTNLKRDHC